MNKTNFQAVAKHWLHIAVIYALAVAQPLFDIIKDNGTFFVSRSLFPSEIILYTFLFSIGLPLFMGLLLFVASRFSLLFYTFFRKLLLFTSLFLLTLYSLKTLPFGFFNLILALLIGFILLSIYERFNKTQRFLTFLSPTILIVPLLFLFFSPTKSLLFQKDFFFENVALKNKVPVVMIVFDELTTTSLMNEKRSIDSQRYPGFSSLLPDFTWYRSAATVADTTDYAIPAMITGNYPGNKRASPVYNNYPHNIFTVLGNKYKLNVYENLTQICPIAYCQGAMIRDPFWTALKTLFSDTWILYQHILLPKNFKKYLVPIHFSWSHFGQSHIDLMEGHTEVLPLFFERLAKNPLGFHFIHLNQPHQPFIHMPSGKYYFGGDIDQGLIKTDGQIPGKTYHWATEWTAIQAYQRHLLQTGFTDLLLGQILEKVKKAGIYDDALIIVTADHGISFRMGISARHLNPKSPKNAADVLSVPLFVKLPGQKQGKVSDDPVLTIDIVPSIAKTLGLSLPYSVDGMPFSSPSIKKRLSFFAKDTALNKYPVPTELLKDRYQTLNRKLAVFGSEATKPNGLYNIGPYQHLIGKHPEDFRIEQNNNVTVKIFGSHNFKNVDKEKDILPCRVKGNLYTNEKTKTHQKIAIAFNGIFVATTLSWNWENGDERFSAMIAEKHLKKGNNLVEVYLIKEKNKSIWLERPVQADLVTYTLSNNVITAADGEKTKIETDKIIGEVYKIPEKYMPDKDFLIFSGWAANKATNKPVNKVLVFVDGKFIQLNTRPNKESKKAVKRLGAAVSDSGFIFVLNKKDLESLWGIKATRKAQFEFIAVSHEGEASQLEHKQIKSKEDFFETTFMIDSQKLLEM